jgi:hypothetical protein
VKSLQDILAECVDALMADRDPYAVLRRYPGAAEELAPLIEIARRVRDSSPALDEAAATANVRAALQLPLETAKTSDLATVVAGAAAMAFTLSVLFTFQEAVPSEALLGSMAVWLAWWLSRAPFRRGGDDARAAHAGAIHIESPVQVSCRL